MECAMSNVDLTSAAQDAREKVTKTVSEGFLYGAMRRR